MSKAEKIKNFDPNTPGDQDNGLYGLPFTMEDAEVAILPIPWEVTVSYRSGTARAPGAVRMASYQVDLYDEDIPEAWKLGVAMDEILPEWIRKNTIFRKIACQLIEELEAGDTMPQEEYDKSLAEINEVCESLMFWVEEKCQGYLGNGQIPVVLGGDHSTPLGLIRALGYLYDNVGILQVDAHADLRKAYEGFEYSHASIMYNALKSEHITKLVQVGIRDWCDEEVEYVKNSNGRVVTHTWRSICESKYKGISWDKKCDEIIAELPQDVYISFDIDGLDPSLSPHTGTPVPGGFQYEEIIYLLKKVVESGRRIVGFDLVEVSPGNTDWDAIVGSRLLYRMCNLAGRSQGKI